MQSQRYFAYLLRLRHVDNAGAPRWVITLHEPDRDDVHSFADLIDLIIFLKNRITESVDPLKEETS